jgi:anti-sigma regulatory factor (Ser/Thr protein kinase)
MRRVDGPGTRQFAAPLAQRRGLGLRPTSPDTARTTARSGARLPSGLPTPPTRGPCEPVQVDTPAAGRWPLRVWLPRGWVAASEPGELRPPGVERGFRIQSIALQPKALSSRAARSFAAQSVAGHEARFRETVVLLVSELVSNAVQHGGPHGPDSSVGLTVEERSGGVRVEVTDAGNGDPIPCDGPIDRPSGRGLLLVEALASRWGCKRMAVGKTVWFELGASSGGEADG